MQNITPALLDLIDAELSKYEAAAHEQDSRLGELDCDTTEQRRKLWNDHREAMMPLLAQRDEIIRTLAAIHRLQSPKPIIIFQEKRSAMSNASHYELERRCKHRILTMDPSELKAAMIAFVDQATVSSIHSLAVYLHLENTPAELKE